MNCRTIIMIFFRVQEKRGRGVDLYGNSIALTIRSVDRSLWDILSSLLSPSVSSQLILAQTMTIRCFSANVRTGSMA